MTTFETGARVVVRAEYVHDRPGRAGVVLGPQFSQFNNCAGWTPIMWDDEEDPDWIKTVALEPEPTTEETHVTIVVRSGLGFLDTMARLMKAAEQAFPGPVEARGVDPGKAPTEIARLVEERNAAMTELHRLRCERVSLEDRVTMADHEREAIRDALFLADGNRKKAAERLAIGERTLYRKIEEYSLQDVGAKVAT